MPSLLPSQHIENYLPHRTGYPSLAAWIARDPDNETYVFRKFDRMSARNLLNLQNEMLDLESNIDLKDKDMIAERKSNMDALRSMRRWESYKDENAQPTVSEVEKIKLENDLRCKIKEYPLLLQCQIASLDQLSNRLFRIFSEYFHGRNGEGAIVHGKAQHILKDLTDLVALRSPFDTDPLSCLVRDYWPFQGSMYPEPDDRTRHFRESRVQRVVLVLTTVFAAILLVGAITTLYFIKQPSAKLGLLAAFTSLFAASVGTLTSARRQEVFAASAAYAAVLVVFVSGDFDKATSS